MWPRRSALEFDTNPDLLYTLTPFNKKRTEKTTKENAQQQQVAFQ